MELAIMKTFPSIMRLGVLMLCLAPGLAFAEAVDTTNFSVFQSGDPAMASEVNANFDALKTAVDDNADDIDTNRADIELNILDISANSDALAVNAGAIDANDQSISTLSTQKQDQIFASCSPGSFVSEINPDGSYQCGVESQLSIGSCPVDSAIRVIDPNGSVTCQSLPNPPRTLSIPASALAFGPADPVARHSHGLLWDFFGAGGASLLVAAPPDYAGGDVTFSIFFRTTTATTGAVSFVLEPNSFDAGDTLGPAGLVSGTPIAVGGSSMGLYEQSFTIPELLLSSGWWYSAMRRQGSGANYVDDIVVMSVAFTYQP